jgi:hypothetical protein
MKLPDFTPSRKPPSRWWLFGPYILVIIAALVWTGVWLWLSHQVAARLDAAAHPAPGHASVTCTHRTISGYPFRIEVVLDGFKASEPSGWAVSTPQVRAEAYAYKPQHWIAYAPHGIVLSRPNAGDVAITGPDLRATATFDKNEFVFEGRKLAFAPKLGAKSFPLIAADMIDAHSRALDGDKIEFLVQMQGVTLSPAPLLGRLAVGQPMSSAWHGTLSKASSLTGHDWPDVAKAWAAAGGTIDIAAGDLDVGAVKLSSTGGQLSVGPDGRLQGGVSLGLGALPAAVTAFGDAGALEPVAAHNAAVVAQASSATDPNAKATLNFQAGATTFGPVSIGPAPRVY